MEEAKPGPGKRTTLKILGREYRIRTDEGEEHIAAVSEYVDGILREVRKTSPDTQDAAVLGILNIASELLRTRDSVIVPRERVQALIEQIESA